MPLSAKHETMEFMYKKENQAVLVNFANLRELMFFFLIRNHVAKEE